MTGRHKHTDVTHQPRRDSMYEERVHDPYQARGKYHEPTVCPDCGAVFHQGRWRWGSAPEGSHSHRCPACARLHDRMPAGVLTLQGEFFDAHRTEIMHLIQHQEATEKPEHPLERIMAIDDTEQGSTVSFTGVHLARRAGEALHHAYQGELDIGFNDKDDLFRMRWSR